MRHSKQFHRRQWVAEKGVAHAMVRGTRLVKCSSIQCAAGKLETVCFLCGDLQARVSAKHPLQLFGASSRASNVKALFWRICAYCAAVNAPQKRGRIPQCPGPLVPEAKDPQPAGALTGHSCREAVLDPWLRIRTLQSGVYGPFGIR